MGEIKLDYNIWSVDVVSYSSSIDALSDLSKPALSENDLQPFLKINTMIDELNSSIKTFKSCLDDVCAMRFSDTDVSRAVTGTYGDVTKPQSPQSRGTRGFLR